MARELDEMRRLGGVIPPLATPFTEEGAVDEAALRREVQYVLDAGVHGLTLTGSTGEGHTLSVEESCRIAAVALEETNGRVPVISGIIRDSTGEVIRYGRALRAEGVDGLQITPVHYLFQPGDDGTVAYYAEIANAVGLPIVLYNVVPWNLLTPELLLRLVAEVPMVVGVKQSAGDLHKLADLLAAGKDRLRVLTAVDALLYPSFVLGAHGAVAAILTVLPELCVRLWNAVHRDDHAEALALHERILPVWRVLEAPDLPARVKAALALQGRPVGLARRPTQPVGAAVEERLRRVMAASGVLPATARG